jgi:hypothetical protein
MYLQESFNKILKTTPTAYIAYETIKKDIPEVEKTIGKPFKRKDKRIRTCN